MNAQSILSLLRKNIISVFAVALIIGGGIRYMMTSGVKEDLKGEYADLSLKRSRILKNIKNGNGVEADIERMKELMAEAESRLFRPKELATNYNYFFTLESETGVKLASLQQVDAPPTDQKAKESKAAFQPITYNIRVEGEFGQVMEFMRRLEGGKAFARSTRFGFGPASKGAEEGAMALTAIIEVLGVKG